MLMPRQSSYPQHPMMQQQQQQQMQGQQQAQYDAQYAAAQMHMPPQPSQHLISSLQHCVSSAASCVQTMKEAIDTLEFAIQDHPRLMTVLKSQRHFDLVSQRDIESAREHVATEVRPYVEELCRRATAEIQRQDRRAVALKNKYEALQQRIQNIRSIDLHQSKLTSAAAEESKEKEAETEEKRQAREELQKQQRTMAQLKARKEALLAKADELESEAGMS
ncbi:hypothetical protein NDA18_003893 [Ustilago nuda]|nr:hypothetical protein NDA18_003893 [Ustilago nuda]